MINFEPQSAVVSCCTVLPSDEHWKTLIRTGDVLSLPGSLVEEFPARGPFHRYNELSWFQCLAGTGSFLFSQNAHSASKAHTALYPTTFVSKPTVSLTIYERTKHFYVKTSDLFT